MLSKIDEIVELAKIYIENYKISPIEAIECAMQDIEERDKEESYEG